MRILQNKAFVRFTKRFRIAMETLCKAIDEAERGLISADLGGGLIKQRIARVGGGKSGGFRVLIAYRPGLRAFFVHGFSKNEEENINQSELVALKRLASELFSYDDNAIVRAVVSGTLMEVICDEETIQ